MRIALIALLLLMPATTFAAGATQATLRQRCLVAIPASGEAADVKSLKQTLAVPLGDSGFLFQFADRNAGTFSCQICDDANPANHACASIGLELSYRPKDGEMRRLPAELDRKCTYFLQKESRAPGATPFIDHDMVKRIHVSGDHTDSRWVYNMQLDGKDFRCVIRKSDGSFRVEKQQGDDWKPIANGVLW